MENIPEDDKVRFLLDAVRSDNKKTVEKVLTYLPTVPQCVCNLAKERGVEGIIALLIKQDEEDIIEMKKTLKEEIAQNKAGIFNLIPRFQEFLYNSKKEKLSPLLPGTPVELEELKDKLLVPKVHVEENCQRGCTQKTNCSNTRSIYKVVKDIVRKLSDCKYTNLPSCSDIFQNMDTMLIGSLKEGTRVFFHDELDIHISLDEEKFKNRTSYDTNGQQLLLDGNKFDCKAYFDFFLLSVHGILKNLPLEDPAMRPISTSFIACMKCMRMENGQAQAYRCRHKPDFEVHKQCQCREDEDCSCECDCKEYISPGMTRTKVGLGLHFGELRGVEKSKIFQVQKFPSKGGGFSELENSSQVIPFD